MTDDPNATSRDIIRFAMRDIAEADLGLVSRGLDGADEIKVTPQQIADARTNNPSFANLSNMAIKIALEQRANWEFILFSQIISDEVLAADGLFNVVLKKPTRSGSYMDTQQTINACVAKLDDMMGLLQRIKTLLYELKVTWSSSEPDKLGSIITLSHNYGLLYREALNWLLDVLSWNVHEAFYYYLLILRDTMLPIATQMAFAGPKGLSIIGNDALALERQPIMTVNLDFDVPLDPQFIASTLQQAVWDAQK